MNTIQGLGYNSTAELNPGQPTAKGALQHHIGGFLLCKKTKKLGEVRKASIAGVAIYNPRREIW